MILLWSTIVALVGLTSAVAFPRGSGFYTLTQDKIDSTDVFANYAAAVKCNPQNIIHWNCVRAYLSCVSFVLLHKERVVEPVSDAPLSLSSSLRGDSQFRGIRKWR